MKRILIIVHVWNPPGIDQYARHLRFLLGSLHRWPPRNCDVGVVVCCSESDTPTMQVFSDTDGDSYWRSRLIRLYLTDAQLFRRGHGRNIIALRADADILWFADADYFAGPDCLDSIAAQMDADSGLCMPHTILICRNHEAGDRLLEQTRGQTWPEPDLSLFVPRPEKVAIGGCQLVGRKLANHVGYCNGTEWAEPVPDPERGFRSCKCDWKFRILNGLQAERIAVAQMYRIRHSRAGRDFDRLGEFVGKETQ